MDARQTWGSAALVLVTVATLGTPLRVLADPAAGGDQRLPQLQQLRIEFDGIAHLGPVYEGVLALLDRDAIKIPDASLRTRLNNSISYENNYMTKLYLTANDLDGYAAQMEDTISAPQTSPLDPKLKASLKTDCENLNVLEMNVAGDSDARKQYVGELDDYITNVKGAFPGDAGALENARLVLLPDTADSVLQKLQAACTRLQPIAAGL